MKKLFFCSLFSIMAFLLFAQSTPLEARHHRHRDGRVQVGLGANVVAGGAYVEHRSVRTAAARPIIVAQEPRTVLVTQDTRPVIVAQETRPVVVAQEPCAPVYVYSAPTYVAPVYVEEVRVMPRPRPLTFGGLSFFLNLF